MPRFHRRQRPRIVRRKERAVQDAIFACVINHSLKAKLQAQVQQLVNVVRSNGVRAAKRSDAEGLQRWNLPFSRVRQLTIRSFQRRARGELGLNQGKVMALPARDFGDLLEHGLRILDAEAPVSREAKLTACPPDI